MRSRGLSFADAVQLLDGDSPLVAGPALPNMPRSAEPGRGRHPGRARTAHPGRGLRRAGRADCDRRPRPRAGHRALDIWNAKNVGQTVREHRELAEQPLRRPSR